MTLLVAQDYHMVDPGALCNTPSAWNPNIIGFLSGDGEWQSANFAGLMGDETTTVNKWQVNIVKN
jgi:hypothetical protein